MGRNYKRNVYPQPPLRSDSLTLEHLQEEARTRGVALSTHLADLLNDREAAVYGTGESRGIWFPRGVPVQPAAPARESAEPDIQSNLKAFSQFLDEDDMPTVPRMAAVGKE